MYRISPDLDLSKAIGQFATQIHVGQFDLQFHFGPVKIAVQSPIRLERDGSLLGEWKEGQWPSPAFIEVMNTNITSCEIPNNQTIIITFENGIKMHLTDNSDQYECMQITIKGEQIQWII